MLPGVACAMQWRMDNERQLPPVNDGCISPAAAAMLQARTSAIPPEPTTSTNADVLILDGDGGSSVSTFPEQVLQGSPGSCHRHSHAHPMTAYEQVLAAEAGGLAFPNEAREEARLWAGARRPSTGAHGSSRPHVPLLVGEHGAGMSMNDDVRGPGTHTHLLSGVHASHDRERMFQELPFGCHGWALCEGNALCRLPDALMLVLVLGVLGGVGCA